jgi:hypothetical protein
MAGIKKSLAKCIEQYGEERGKIEFERILRERERASTRRSVSDSAPKIECAECHKKFNRITSSHVMHGCNVPRTLSEYIEAFPDAPIVSDACKQSTGITENGMILKYGEAIGKEKWARYVSLQSETNTFEYKEKKFGYTREDFDDFNKSRAVTLEKCIERHGDELGNEMWNNYLELQRYTNTLEYYEEKYGDDGKRLWEEYNYQKGNSNRIDYIQEKYGVTQAEAEEIISKRRPINSSSKLELEFLDNLEVALGEQIKYTAKTRQFAMWSNLLDAPVFFDATDTTRNKIVEFNGDYWHCNPKKYDATFVNTVTNKTAADIWLRDEMKTKTANDRGFEVKTVWEADYLANPIQTITEVKEWLLK